MPDSDRYWKLYLWVGNLWIVGWFAVASVLAGYAVLSNWQAGASLFDHVDVGQTWQILWFSLGGAIVRSEGRRAGKRYDRRARFMTGDLTAIPLAKESLTDWSEDALTPLPFELTGPSLTGTSVGTLLIGLGLLLLMLFAPVALILAGFVLSSPSINTTAISGPFVVFIAIGVAALVEFLLVMGLRRISRDPLSSRLIATDEGLVKPRGRRAPTVLPWRDARLFEVAPSRDTNKSTHKRAFALESPRATISWYEWPKTDPAKLRNFLAVVSQRSGLELRTLAPELAVPHESIAEALTPKPVLRSFFLWFAAFSLGVLALSCAVMVFSITGSLPVDAAIAFSLAIHARYFVAFAIKQRQTRAQSVAAQPFALPPAQDVTAQTAVRIDDWVSIQRRAVNGILTLLYALDLVAAFAAATRIAIPWPGRSASRQETLPQLLLIAIMVIALISLLFTCLTAINRSTRITADHNALIRRRGSKETRIPWSAIADIEISPIDELHPTFTVIADAEEAISWSGGREPRFNPLPGAFRVTAEELAAIAVQRSGRPLSLAQE